MATTDRTNKTEPTLVGSGRHMRQQPVKSRKYTWLALSCVGVLLFVAAVAGVSLIRLRSNVHTASLNLGSANAQADGGPLDILVIGSDTRQGNNSSYGDSQDAQSSARSDVMMLVQVSEDRQNVSVLSFPRDLMVDIPQCTDPVTGEVYPAGENVQINESLSHGGPGCTVATISSITGVNINHFMLADFNAVKSLSSVVGGVDVCVTKPIDDSYSGLKLPAGVSSVEGEQALAFLRSRHGYGDGSDTSRISAQQSFLSSLLRKTQAEGTLNNPSKMMNIAEAITQNVTVDQGLTNPRTLVDIGSIFSGVELSKVVFATVPNEPFSGNENKLQIADSAQPIFERLREDRGLLDEQKTASTEVSPSSDAPSATQASATPSAEATAAEPRMDAAITVLNASGKSDRGQEIQQLIESADFSHVSVQKSDVQYNASAVYYPAGYRAEAEKVAQKLGISRVEATAAYSTVTAVIGTDFTQGDSLKQEQGKIVGDANGQTASQVTCQQSFEY
ncbi:LCP family protein [Rothia sp. LK2588]|uniref:LCP family protein n=1 Tax=Rothia sp. LK2588 TaxID=3114369 RepID=UPI0034D01042